jgi:hypothetical protein
VYADETYIHSSHTTSYGWDDGSGAGLKVSISKGRCLIIVHAVNKHTHLTVQITGFFILNKSILFQVESEVPYPMLWLKKKCRLPRRREPREL